MTATDSIAELQRQQAAIYAAEAARLDAQAAELRRRYPDAAWGGPPLRMPLAEFEPDSREQQAFADRYRVEHANADVLFDGRTSRLQSALTEWRTGEASRRHHEMIARRQDGPSCEICGADADRQALTIAGRRTFICSAHRPSVLRSVAKYEDARKLPDGRSTAAACDALVAGLLKTGSDR